MRAQLDGQDPRLPGTGVFDIKTRAVLPIRLDMLNYKVCIFPPFFIYIQSQLCIVSRSLPNNEHARTLQKL